MVERDVVRVVDLDPVLAADDRDVPDGDIVRGNDDSPTYDRAGVADEILRPIEHERPLVHPRRKPHGRRLHGKGDSAAERERREHENGDRETGVSELPAVLPVRQAEVRKDSMREDLGERPGAREEGERDEERRRDPERKDDAHDGRELRGGEWKREPTGLVVEPSVE